MQNSLSNPTIKYINYIHVIMDGDKMLILSPNEPMVELEKKYYAPGIEKFTITTCGDHKLIMYEAILRIDNDVVEHGVAYTYNEEEPNYYYSVYVDNSTDEYLEGCGRNKDVDPIGVKERLSAFIEHLVKVLEAPNTEIHLNGDTYWQAFNDYLDTMS